MKKIILIIAVIALAFNSNAQLNVQRVDEYAGYKTLYTIKYLGSTMGEIRYIDNYGFVLFGVTDNQFEEKMASIFLGKTKDEAGRSIADLSAFYLNAKYGEYVVDGAFGAKTYIIISKMVGRKGIQIKTEGVAGISGIPSWICIKDNIYSDVLHAIYGFNEQTTETANN